MAEETYASADGWTWRDECIWQARQIEDAAERERYIEHYADMFSTTVDEIRNEVNAR